MKRLTFDGEFCEIALCREMCEDVKCSAKKVWERLKEIEDLLGDNYDLDHLRELVKAEKEGLLVVLPCKVGDNIFIVKNDSKLRS